jgi:chromosome segregation ATPase
VDIDYDLIIELQRLDTEIGEASLVLEGIPRLIQDIDRKIQTDSKLVADAKGKMSQNQKKRRDLEAEVKDIKVQIGKYKRQLNEVKTRCSPPTTSRRRSRPQPTGRGRTRRA